MKDNNQEFKTRLAKIWESSDFSDFFKKYSKQPPRLVKKRTVLFNPGDPLTGIYFIKEGFIKLYRVSEEGKETIIYLTGPGDLLGLRALISKGWHSRHCAEALTDVKLYTITREVFFEVLTQHPEHLIDLIHIFITRLDLAEQRLEGFISADATSRLAVFLSGLVHRFGCKKSGKINLPIRLTHQRIAEFIGSVRETVTDSIAQLEKEKVIKSKRGEIIILDLKKLENYTSLTKQKD